jgi:Protein of unknown function (DUF2458)
MNRPTDVSATLASLLAILAQSSQQSRAQPNPASPLPICPSPAHNEVEPVVSEGNGIFETSQWIGVPTTSWREPQKWHLPPRKPINPPPFIPSVKKREELSHVAVTATYPEAIKLVIQKLQSNDFLVSLQRMKRRQHELEETMFEERCRIQRKYESKRKMNQVLKNLGSTRLDEEVGFPLVYFAQSLQETLLKEEQQELDSFDTGVIKKLEELVCDQRRELGALGVPYFDVEDEKDPERVRHQQKIFGVLEDLIPGPGEE